MKVLKIIGIILGIVILAFVIAYGYYGGFRKIEVVVEKHSEKIVVYEKMKGDYAQSGEVMNRIFETLKNEYHIETTQGIGFYYDNPKEVETADLRSEIGCIIDAADVDKLTPELEEKFEIKMLEEKDYPTVEFPYKGKISIIVGIIKAYPALTKYADKNDIGTNWYSIEIYDMPNMKTYYLLAQ